MTHLISLIKYIIIDNWSPKLLIYLESNFFLDSKTLNIIRQILCFNIMTVYNTRVGKKERKSGKECHPQNTQPIVMNIWIREWGTVQKVGGVLQCAKRGWRWLWLWLWLIWEVMDECIKTKLKLGMVYLRS